MLLAVAAGGALGAVGRYLVVSAVGQVFGTGFPLGTIVVNVVGSFLLGALTEAMALAWSPSPELRAMIAIGVLGAFTTFSAFSLDVALLYERGALGQAALYAGASVVLSIGAFFLGLALLRSTLG